MSIIAVSKEPVSSCLAIPYLTSACFLTSVALHRIFILSDLNLYSSLAGAVVCSLHDFHHFQVRLHALLQETTQTDCESAQSTCQAH